MEASETCQGKETSVNREGDVKSRLAWVLETGEGADVCFLLGENEEPVLAHKILLGCSTNELFTLVQDTFGANVKLEDVDPKMFKRLLKLVYTDEVEREDIIPFLEFANTFGFANLPKSQSQLVKKEGISIRNVVFGLNIGKFLKDEKLVEECSRFIEKHAEAVFRDPSIVEMDAEELGKFLKGDDLCCDDELILFKALLRWARHRWKEGDLWGHIGPMRLYIRYTLIPYKQLLVEVEKSGVLKLEEHTEITRTKLDPGGNPLRLNTKERGKSIQNSFSFKAMPMTKKKVAPPPPAIGSLTAKPPILTKDKAVQTSYNENSSSVSPEADQGRSETLSQPLQPMTQPEKSRPQPLEFIPLSLESQITNELPKPVQKLKSKGQQQAKSPLLMRLMKRSQKPQMKPNESLPAIHSLSETQVVKPTENKKTQETFVAQPLKPGQEQLKKVEKIAALMAINLDEKTPAKTHQKCGEGVIVPSETSEKQKSSAPNKSIQNLVTSKTLKAVAEKIPYRIPNISIKSSEKRQETIQPITVDNQKVSQSIVPNPQSSPVLQPPPLRRNPILDLVPHLPHNPIRICHFPEGTLLFQNCSLDQDFLIQVCREGHNIIRHIKLENVRISFSPEFRNRAFLPCLESFVFRQNEGFEADYPSMDFMGKKPSLKNFLFFSKYPDNEGRLFPLANILFSGINIVIQTGGALHFGMDQEHGSLTLSNPMTRETSEILEKIPLSVKTINISGCQIANSEKFPVALLDELVLHSNEFIGEESSRFLAKFWNLKKLSFFSKYGKWDAINLTRLQCQDKLLFLSLSNCNIRMDKIPDISPFEKLSILYLNCCRLPEFFICTIPQNFPVLEQFGFRSYRYHSITTAQLQRLLLMPRLELVTISKPKFQFTGAINQTGKSSEDLTWLSSLLRDPNTDISNILRHGLTLRRNFVTGNWLWFETGEDPYQLHYGMLGLNDLFSPLLFSKMEEKEEAKVFRGNTASTTTKCANVRERNLEIPKRKAKEPEQLSVAKRRRISESRPVLKQTCANKETAESISTSQSLNSTSTIPTEIQSVAATDAIETASAINTSEDTPQLKPSSADAVIPLLQKIQETASTNLTKFYKAHFTAVLKSIPKNVESLLNSHAENAKPAFPDFTATGKDITTKVTEPSQKKLNMSKQKNTPNKRKKQPQIVDNESVNSVNTEVVSPNKILSKSLQPQALSHEPSEKSGAKPLDLMPLPMQSHANPAELQNSVSKTTQTQQTKSPQPKKLMKQSLTQKPEASKNLKVKIANKKSQSVSRQSKQLLQPQIENPSNKMVTITMETVPAEIVRKNNKKVTQKFDKIVTTSLKESDTPTPKPDNSIKPRKPSPEQVTPEPQPVEVVTLPHSSQSQLSSEVQLLSLKIPVKDHPHPYNPPPLSLFPEEILHFQNCILDQNYLVQYILDRHKLNFLKHIRLENVRIIFSTKRPAQVFLPFLESFVFRHDQGFDNPYPSTHFMGEKPSLKNFLIFNKYPDNEQHPLSLSNVLFSGVNIVIQSGSAVHFEMDQDDGRLTLSYPQKSETSEILKKIPVTLKTMNLSGCDIKSAENYPAAFLEELVLHSNNFIDQDSSRFLAKFTNLKKLSFVGKCGMWSQLNLTRLQCQEKLVYLSLSKCNIRMDAITFVSPFEKVSTLYINASSVPTYFIGSIPQNFPVLQKFGIRSFRRHSITTDQLQRLLFLPKLELIVISKSKFQWVEAINRNGKSLKDLTWLSSIFLDENTSILQTLKNGIVLRRNVLKKEKWIETTENPYSLHYEMLGVKDLFSPSLFRSLEETEEIKIFGTQANNSPILESESECISPKINMVKHSGKDREIKTREACQIEKQVSEKAEAIDNLNFPELRKAQKREGLLTVNSPTRAKLQKSSSKTNLNLKGPASTTLIAISQKLPETANLDLNISTPILKPIPEVESVSNGSVQVSNGILPQPDSSSTEEHATVLQLKKQKNLKQKLERKRKLEIQRGKYVWKAGVALKKAPPQRNSGNPVVNVPTCNNVARKQLENENLSELVKQQEALQDELKKISDSEKSENEKVSPTPASKTILPQPVPENPIRQHETNKNLQVENESGECAKTDNQARPPPVTQTVSEVQEENKEPCTFSRKNETLEWDTLVSSIKLKASLLTLIDLRNVELKMPSEFLNTSFNMPHLKSFTFSNEEKKSVRFPSKNFLPGKSFQNLLVFWDNKKPLHNLGPDITIHSGGGTHLEIAKTRLIIGYPESQEGNKILGNVPQDLKVFGLSGFELGLNIADSIPTKSLEEVYFYNVAFNSLTCSNFLSKCCNLRKLVLKEKSKGKISYANGLAKPLSNSRMTLQYLSLSNTTINHFLYGPFPSLKTLYLHECKILPSVFDRFPKVFPNLQEFGINSRRNEGIAYTDLQMLIKEMGKIQKIHVHQSFPLLHTITVLKGQEDLRQKRSYEPLYKLISQTQRDRTMSSFILTRITADKNDWTGEEGGEKCHYALMGVQPLFSKEVLATFESQEENGPQ